MHKARKALARVYATLLAILGLRSDSLTSYRKWARTAYVPAFGGADVAGGRGTGNISADQREVDMAKRIALLEPDEAPLTVFTKRIKGKQTATGSPEFSWLEDELKNRFDTVSGAQTNVETAIEVANIGRWRIGDLGKNTATGEVFRVTAVGAGLTVVRGLASTNLAMTDGDELLIIGSAAEEGARSKAAQSNNPDKVTNYTQIFREPVEQTETLRHSNLRTKPNDWRYQQNKAGIEHRKDIEQSSLFGVPSELAGTSHPIRTTGGAFHFLGATNQTDAGGALTEAEFFNSLRAPFRYGGKTKLGLASPLVVDVLNSFPRAKLEVTRNDRTYGVSVMQYITPRGTLNLIEHNLFEGDEYEGFLLILDMDAVHYRYLANEEGSRDTRLLENRQDNDADGRKDEYLTECGLEFGSPKRHGSIVGITG